MRKESCRMPSASAFSISLPPQPRGAFFSQATRCDPVSGVLVHQLSLVEDVGLPTARTSLLSLCYSVDPSHCNLRSVSHRPQRAFLQFMQVRILQKHCCNHLAPSGVSAQPSADCSRVPHFFRPMEIDAWTTYDNARLTPFYTAFETLKRIMHDDPTPRLTEEQRHLQKSRYYVRLE